MQQFLGRSIQVEFDQLTGFRMPKKIKFDSQEKKILEVLSHWEDHTKEKNWRMRHHRVYYLARCDDGFVYKFYWDRGGKGQSRVWFLVERST